VLKTPLNGPFPSNTEVVSVGMGCFWCSEALFWKLKGVYSTHAGYQQGVTANPTYKEVCTGRTNHNEVESWHSPEMHAAGKEQVVHFSNARDA
jgi:peptide-methionine (S)-S-oxide reductase